MKIYKDKMQEEIETKIIPNIKIIYESKIKNIKDKYIAQMLGVSINTFNEALKREEIVRDTYNDAIEVLVGQLNDVVIGRALGTDGLRNEKGELMPPDHNLAYRLLEKFDPRYKQKQEIESTITIETVIRQIANKEREELK